MSTDQKITQDLVKIAHDGHEGYTKGAEELTGSDHPELAVTFQANAVERQKFATELQALAATYGDTVQEKGSPVAALHRGWMALRDAVTGSGPDSVLKTAIQGEDHAIKEYEKALEAEISDGTRTIAQRQLAALQSDRQELQRLLDTLSR